MPCGADVCVVRGGQAPDGRYCSFGTALSEGTVAAVAKTPSQSKAAERPATRPPARRAARQEAAAAVATPSKRAASKGAAELTPAQLAAECRRLSTELETAKARVAELEASQRQAIDRIAWAIDSLHSLVEDAPD